ncbi:MAG: ACT domain-containing protein [Eubacteriales bacterium]|nr:ACT domain-containing protein [Eubacteriales bacterium]
MDKIIITVVGKDRIGIMAKVCTILADCGVNVLDISQSITGGLFNMIMVADMTKADVTHRRLSEALEEAGRTLGVQIKAQREDIFLSMHRV